MLFSFMYIPNKVSCKLYMHQIIGVFIDFFKNLDAIIYSYAQFTSHHLSQDTQFYIHGIM